MTYAMFSDDALSKFRTFCDAAGFVKPPSPQGAFDAALPKAKFRFVPVPHSANTLFLRERSNNFAFDEATEISDPAKDILNFLRSRLSDDDMAQVEELLKMEAGVKTDNEKETDAMIAGAKERGATAQDAKRRQLALDASAAASTARMDDFASRFPGAARIGHA